MITQPLDKQLPYGVADLFFKDAARKRAVERAFVETFSRWGYSEIIPPMFEYYESLAAEAGPQLREEMYRFFDRDGHTLALRADFTIPIARIVGTKLADRVMPLRFFYVGSVFRYEEPQAGVRREFTQAGIELIGAATADADVEAIALAIAALRALGLDGFRFTLGNVAFLHAILRSLELGEADDLALRNALRRKNASALASLLDSLAINPTGKRILAALPALWGGNEVLDRAEELCSGNHSAQATVDHMRQVVLRLAQLGFEKYVVLDLAENRGMAYYTGILFEGFVPGMGFSIVSGGRYDNLISHFGPSIPAVGFAIGVERALMALRPGAAARPSVAPDVIAQWCDDVQPIEEARQRGQVVEIDVLSTSDDDLREYARVRGAREIWFRDGRRETLA